MWSSPSFGIAVVSAALALAVAHAIEARVEAGRVWFPNLRLFKRHSDRSISAYMSEIADRPFNHQHVSITELHPPVRSPSSLRVPTGMKVNARRQLLGRGRQVYERAVEKGLRERGVVDHLSWAKLPVADTDSRRWKPGMALLTVAKCYGVVWSANPCRLVHAYWDRNLPRDMGRGKYSSVCFSTVVGHLLAGEERFSVEWHQSDDSVWLDLFSVSEGNGILGKIATPLVRPISKRFFAAQCHHMLKLVSGEEDA